MGGIGTVVLVAKNAMTFTRAIRPSNVLSCLTTHLNERRSIMEYIDLKIEAMIPKGRKITPEVFKEYEERFFAKAHEHFYGCTPDLRIEIAQYHRGVISSTMTRYVQYLMGEEWGESLAPPR